LKPRRQWLPISVFSWAEAESGLASSLGPGLEILILFELMTGSDIVL
jgi:hypothetical protein